MKETLTAIAEYIVLAIDAMAVFAIVIGTVEAFLRGLRVAVSSSTGYERRQVWLRYDRWLVAGLTFLLAADIVESTITSGWENLGRLAVIALIRTFLNYFLEKDVAEMRERQHEKTE
jgi:uncharacterized membrane protein